jgi:transcriptional regulator with XRE-family HTH domain
VAEADVHYDLSMPKLRFSDPDAVRFGAILRRLRLTRGWTIVVAAQRCGMNPNYLGALEKGGNMPSVETLLEIADVYGVNASDIVREVEEARRAARKAQAAAVAASTPPVE